MLWDAGQKRMVREGRERLTELYVGVRDGYAAVLLGSKIQPPEYTRSDNGARPAARDLMRLLSDFPGVEHGAVPGKFQN